MNEYKTNDLWFASVLIALGFRAMRVEGDLPKKNFVLDVEEDEAQAIYKNYVIDELEINARTLLVANAQAKAMAFARS